MKKYIVLFLLFISFFVYIKKNEIDSFPVNLSNQNVCSNDGMIIVDYKGPKAQIVWKDGTISFYCDVKEAFFEWIDLVKRKRIKKFFVQDFSSVKWGSYTNNWIEAHKVVYIIDSLKYGAMGISYVPFSDIIYANLFLNKYGGVIVNFDDIIKEVLIKSNEILEDRMINICT
ncbi:MAG: nitrous oxide reductase accessory protein NosL [Candidatus Azosocius agrarius]|nr:MAG: nitrous oxide reductase accessory protein NosL [Gammaproteobacteria bacterium]